MQNWIGPQQNKTWNRDITSAGTFNKEEESEALNLRKRLPKYQISKNLEKFFYFWWLEYKTNHGSCYRDVCLSRTFVLVVSQSTWFLNYIFNN